MSLTTILKGGLNNKVKVMLHLHYTTFFQKNLQKSIEIITQECYNVYVR